MVYRWRFIWWLIVVAGTGASVLSIEQQVDQRLNRCMDTETLGGVQQAQTNLWNKQWSTGVLWCPTAWSFRLTVILSQIKTVLLSVLLMEKWVQNAFKRFTTISKTIVKLLKTLCCFLWTALYKMDLCQVITFYTWLHVLQSPWQTGVVLLWNHDFIRKQFLCF